MSGWPGGAVGDTILSVKVTSHYGADPPGDRDVLGTCASNPNHTVCWTRNLTRITVISKTTIAHRS